MLGLGTFEQAPGGPAHPVGVKGISAAIELGYRHIDSAMFYGTHRDIGAAVAASGIDRSEFFLTTKVYRDRLARDDVVADCRRALAELGTEYLDLYLIHWPNDDIAMSETLEAMSALVAEGAVRDVGVANFTRSNLARAIEVSPVSIAVNQVELHPFLSQTELRTFCAEHGVAVTGYAPLAQGAVLTDSRIASIASEQNRSPAQVALRWLVQRGVAAIPKSSTRSHLAENLEVFDFALSPTDLRHLDAMDRNRRIFQWDVARFDE